MATTNATPKLRVRTSTEAMAQLLEDLEKLDRHQWHVAALDALSTDHPSDLSVGLCMEACERIAENWRLILSRKRYRWPDEVA